MQRHVVARAADLPPGSSLIVELGGRSIGVFNHEGRLHALRNSCPHHGAPLCLGAVTGRMTPSPTHTYEYSHEPVLRCPWHGYEFDLEDGRSKLHPDTLRVKTYRVEREADEIVVYS
ncbi:MAG TPA: Rieske (2Fe-2S) protein [Solirubrobacterales bacterium]|nr:Rieske (2Fe-2S) protein [Solirubrobacterales bacterium]